MPHSQSCPETLFCQLHVARGTGCQHDDRSEQYQFSVLDDCSMTAVLLLVVIVFSTEQ